MRVSVPVSLGTTGSGRLQLSPWLLVVLLSFYSGVVQAVLTTDVDLSKEAVGVGLLLWFLFLAVIPLALWWRYVHELRGSGHRHGHGKTWPKRFRYVGGKVLLAGLFAVGCAVFLKSVNADTTQTSTVQPVNDQGASQGAASGVGQDIGLASLAAHTYVPSNWVAQRQAFHQLQIAAQSHNVTAGHENLFDSMLGCLGVSSQNGGVNPKFNLCN